MSTTDHIINYFKIHNIFRSLRRSERQRPCPLYLFLAALRDVAASLVFFDLPCLVTFAGGAACSLLLYNAIM